MIWQGNVVNLSNYNRIFKSYSKEVQEVIRGALFDCTEITDYIDRFKNDPYMLWQVKLAIDENLDTEWFAICPDGVSLAKVREMSNRGINMKPLMKLLNGTKLSGVYFKYILKWYHKGIYLGKYNFSILPEGLLEVFDYGISLGAPMHLFNNGVCFEYGYVLSCLKILSNGKDISKFLDGDWDLANISLLAEYSKTKYYDKFIDYIQKTVTPSILEEIYECAKSGLPIREVTVVDTDGLYVFSKIHIALAREAFYKKLAYKKILQPGISISEATSILNELELAKGKRLSGVLHKN